MLPAERVGPSTPHAIRALQQRRAAESTPARDSRRSGRQQRETPREVLRHLSRGKRTIKISDSTPNNRRP